MKRHFHEELKRLKNHLVQMGRTVESAIDRSVEALLSRNRVMAWEVIKNDDVINRLQMEIDREGWSLLALGQPLAVDLRLITMILKINNDLERMGDHAVNIAERALVISDESPLSASVHLPEMAMSSQKMLKDALDSFLNEDVALARSVLKSDDEVDSFNDQLYLQLGKLMEKDPILTRVGMNLMMVGHNLERIADLANNIAEDVIYMKQGKEVRHHVEAK